MSAERRALQRRLDRIYKLAGQLDTEMAALRADIVSSPGSGLDEFRLTAKLTTDLVSVAVDHARTLCNRIGMFLERTKEKKRPNPVPHIIRPLMK